MQTLPKVFTFLGIENLELNKFNHTKFKMDKFDDNHIPTCILDSKTNLGSCVGPYSTWKYLIKKMLGDKIDLPNSNTTIMWRPIFE
jgi:hypothetical protein